ncbi:hypothetical protein [Arcobacter venerupis]|nr:hypothetical protein [Arcobacter venerupis]
MANNWNISLLFNSKYCQEKNINKDSVASIIKLFLKKTILCLIIK